MSWLNLLWMFIVIAACCWVLANILVALFSPLLSTKRKLHSRKHMWFLAALPWVLPLIAIVSLLLLALAKSWGWIHHHCEVHQAHHPHFCLEHLPALAMHFSRSLAAFLLVAGMLGLFIIRVFAQFRLHKLSGVFQKLTTGTSTIKKLNDSRPLAFALGIFKPSIFISKGLQSQLSKRQVRMVISHEIAHLRHNDVLKNTLFEILLSIHLVPQELRSSWYLSSELRADQHVARDFDRFEIAEVLIKLRRLKVNIPFATAINGGHLEARIDVLTQPLISSVRMPPLMAILYLIVCFFPVLLILNHHGLETLWGWLI